MKKAILVVSLGTSLAEADQNCIRPVEGALKHAFPEYEVRRAFTSRKIIKKLRAQGAFIESESEALERLRSEGYSEIFVVPTHIIHGAEYELARAAAGSYAVSGAMLETDDDIRWMAALLTKIAQEEKQPLLLMGHGTEHAADETYARLQRALPEGIFIACIEGKHCLDTRMPELEKLPGRNLTLMPLMLAAGNHARSNMAGDGADSWKSILEAKGFMPRIRMQGLGALDAVQQRFVEKAKKIL